MLHEDSGIDPDIVAERGTFTVRRGKDVPQEHGKLPQKPGLVFPVHTLDGGVFFRLRPNSRSRGAKYLQPKGAPNRLDVHPRQHERIKQPGGMRYVTEGEKKVDGGVSRHLLMVGLSGVWNGQKDGDLIPDWELLPLEGERYSITFDSDIETNPHVQLAADRLAGLLRDRGAEVFITLLPPAPDRRKQGLDDFFANGGTVKELELLTRPYDDAVVERVRLTRDEKLHAAVEDLYRRWWATEWRGQGGHTDRDLALKLIEAARKHGKVVHDGVRVVKAWGPLGLEAKITSSRTVGKSIARLEEIGFCYRDNEGRKADKPGAFVLRASVKQYGEETMPARGPGRTGGGEGPGTLHLRPPRLMWSRPKFTPKRGTVRGTRQVRQTPKPAPRAPIKRLGKVRGAILDALDAAGGSATLQEIAAALHKQRARDLTRRKNPESGAGRDGPIAMLADAGIVAVDGDTVTLAPHWLERLDEQRELGGEIEAHELARERYLEKSRAYHGREKVEPTPHWTNTTADGPIEDLGPEEMSRRHDNPETEISPLATAIRSYLERNPHDACEPPGWIGTTLWALELFDGKPTPGETRAAIGELGGERYLKDALRRTRETA